MDDPYSFSPFETAEPEPKKGRGGSRDSMMLTATMVREDRPEAQIVLRVRNISPGGVMADCSVSIERGAKVEVELRNVGFVPGVIAWARSGKIGVAFEREIDPKATRKPVGTAKPGSHAASVTQSRRPSLRIG